MITKSLIQPINPQSGDEWHSPDGHSPVWKQVFIGDEWTHKELVNTAITGDAANDDSGQESGAAPAAQGVRADGQTSGSTGQGSEQESQEVEDLTADQSA